MIKTKFNLGDEVYYLTENPFPVDSHVCPDCDGAGYYLTVTNRQLDCDKCKGKGQITKFALGWQVLKGEINMIFNEDQKNPLVLYNLFNENEDFYENQLYFAEKEAQAACDKLNKIK